MSLRSSFVHSSMELWGELLVIGDERMGAEIALESLTELVSKVICTAQKKFQPRISSINVAKSSCEFGYIYWRNP